MLYPLLHTHKHAHTGVSVARMWVDRGDVVLIADSQGVRDIYTADGNSLDASTPLSVIVNKGTASAAEVRSIANLTCFVELPTGHISRAWQHLQKSNPLH